VAGCTKAFGFVVWPRPEIHVPSKSTNAFVREEDLIISIGYERITMSYRWP